MQRCRILLAGLCFFFAGCATQQSQTSTFSGGQTMIGRGLAVTLPPPSDFGRKVQASQLLTMSFQGRIITFEARLSITREHLSLVALDTMGRRAMAITWNGVSLTYEKAPWVPAAIDPWAVLADIFMLYGNASVMNAQLAPAGCELIEEPMSRLVRCNGKDILKAEFGWRKNKPWNGMLHYGNLSWGYDVEVQSSEIR